MNFFSQWPILSPPKILIFLSGSPYIYISAKVRTAWLVKAIVSDTEYSFRLIWQQDIGQITFIMSTYCHQNLSPQDSTWYFHIFSRSSRRTFSKIFPHINSIHTFFYLQRTQIPSLLEHKIYWNLLHFSTLTVLGDVFEVQSYSLYNMLKCFFCFVDRATWCIRTIRTNRMHYLLLIYFNN